MCSAGDRPVGVRIGSPVAGRVGRRETKTLKPLDNLLLGMSSRFRAVTTGNARWPRKGVAPEAEPATGRAKAAGPVASRWKRRVTPAGWLAEGGAEKAGGGLRPVFRPLREMRLHPSQDCFGSWAARPYAPRQPCRDRVAVAGNSTLGVCGQPRLRKVSVISCANRA